MILYALAKTVISFANRRVTVYWNGTGSFVYGNHEAVGLTHDFDEAYLMDEDELQDVIDLWPSLFSFREVPVEFDDDEDEDQYEITLH